MDCCQSSTDVRIYSSIAPSCCKTSRISKRTCASQPTTRLVIRPQNGNLRRRRFYASTSGGGREAASCGGTALGRHLVGVGPRRRRRDSTIEIEQKGFDQGRNSAD
jgi:hypothetical protein